MSIHALLPHLSAWCNMILVCGSPPGAGGEGEGSESVADNENENRRKTKKVRERRLTCLEDTLVPLFNCLGGDVNLPTSIAVVLNYCNLNSKRLSVCQH